MKAFSIILPAIPDGCRVQLSNGTTIRYAQLFGDVLTMPTNCNRGVSGIDGSTSTAVGASLAYSGTTLLITGDMSFSYDLSGLASQYNSPRLKIIVMKTEAEAFSASSKARRHCPNWRGILRWDTTFP